MSWPLSFGAIAGFSCERPKSNAPGAFRLPGREHGGLCGRPAGIQICGFGPHVMDYAAARRGVSSPAAVSGFTGSSAGDGGGQDQSASELLWRRLEAPAGSGAVALVGLARDAAAEWAGGAGLAHEPILHMQPGT